MTFFCMQKFTCTSDPPVKRRSSFCDSSKMLLWVFQGGQPREKALGARQRREAAIAAAAAARAPVAADANAGTLSGQEEAAVATL